MLGMKLDFTTNARILRMCVVVVTLSTWIAVAHLFTPGDC